MNIEETVLWNGIIFIERAKISSQLYKVAMLIKEEQHEEAKITLRRGMNRLLKEMRRLDNYLDNIQKIRSANQQTDLFDNKE